MSDEIESLTCEMCGKATPLEDAWAGMQHTCGRVSCLGPRWIAVLIGNLVAAGALHAAYSRGWWAGRRTGDADDTSRHRRLAHGVARRRSGGR